MPDRHLHSWRASCMGALAALLLALLFIGCEIEEAPPPETGSVGVTLVDLAGIPVKGARIRLDGRDTPRFTPAVLTGIPVGAHEIRAFKPGYADTALVVQVVANSLVDAPLTTDRVIGGTIELVGAPPEVVLTVDNVRVTSPSAPIFDGLGVGTFRVSASCPGYATALPAQWTVTLEEGSWIQLTPIFIPAEQGLEPGDLAPDFALPSDWDSSTYRLSDFRGQPVLVSFFFYNCTACVEELPGIAAVYDNPRYNGRVQFFGLDYVDPFPVFARFRDDHPTLNVHFPLLHDAVGKFRDYNVTTMPANFIVDQTGRISSVEGGLSETSLGQIMDQLLDQASRPTFRFEMWDTLHTYTDGNRVFEFYGQVQNLLDRERSVVVALSPVQYADTARQSSICVGLNCLAPTSGPSSGTYALLPQASDTVRFTIYNYISDWSQGYPSPVPSPVTGDYHLDVSVMAADNAAELKVFRLHLLQVGAALTVRSEVLPGPSNFAHPATR